MTGHAAEHPLGAFLRARRELADPAELGLPALGPRRTPGLRREEVATLAGVSAAYYTRLEQGRDAHPSSQVIDALARVLGLDDEARAYLRALTEDAPARRRHRTRRTETVRPRLGQLLARWHGEAAIVVGRYRDVLAANPLAIALNPGYRPGRNLVRDVFLDEEVARVYLDYPQIAEGAVAGLRASVGADVDDPRLVELVGELSVKSPEFRELWSRHEVREKADGTKRFDNPWVGPITLNSESFGVIKADKQTVYVFFPEPGTVDEEKFALLAGLLPADGGEIETKGRA